MKKFLYMRVSSSQQSFERQCVVQDKFSIPDENVYKDRCSGTVHCFQRPGFQKLYKVLEPKDTLFLTDVDRLGRDSQDLQSTLHCLQEKRVQIVILNDKVDSPEELNKHILMAEMEHNKISQRVKEGMYAAREKNVILGRPKAELTIERIEIINNYEDRSISLMEACKQMNVSKTTFYKLKNLKNKGDD